MKMANTAILIISSLTGLGWAQFPPKPQGVTHLQSKFHENVTISFKEVSRMIFDHPFTAKLGLSLTCVLQPGLCETTPGVKSYAGYVHLPPSFLDDGSGVESQEYPINT